MNERSLSILPAIAISLGCAQLIQPVLAKQPVAVKTDSSPQAKVKLYGQVNELLSACYNAGVEIQSTTLPATISKVRMGSAAFYQGLQDKDVIVKGALTDNRLQLTIRRGAAIYGVTLPTDPTAMLTPLTPAADPASKVLSGGAAKQTDTKDPAWKKLKNYDIVMLIDQSGSMGDAVDGNGTTKWDWCAGQLTSFASQALVNTGRKFTIITFNGEYDMKRNCGPEEVHQTFTHNTPAGPTDLATPLDMVLKDYMDGARINPLLVVVLTDGMPARPDFVERSIVDITKRMRSPDQIKIVLFEIGNDADGAALMKMLDFGLISDGAKYDIVDSNSFDQLKQVGLKSALYDTFNQNFSSRLKFSPSSSLAEELETVRKQIRDAKARQAQNPSNR